MNNEFKPTFDPRALIQRGVPAELEKYFERFREGTLQLCVWRNSSPHNWWLSRPGDRNATVYHWPEYGRPAEAFFAFARKVASEGPRVSYGGWMRGGDEGMPCADTWVFEQALFDQAVERWVRGIECAKTFNDLANTRTPDVRALTPHARDIARFLKRSGRHGRMPLSPGAGIPNLEQLVRMGFVRVTPEGYGVPTEALLGQRIPLEKRLAPVV